MRKKQQQAEHNAILAQVIDLILDEQVHDDERAIFVTFKTAVTAGRDFDQAIVIMAESLRQLAVAKLPHQARLSQPAGEFYLSIADKGLLRKNLAGGLIFISGGL